MLEGRSQPTRAYIFYTIYLFHTIFLINFLLPSGSTLHMPPNFFISRLHSQLPSATHVRDSTRDSHSRLPFATPLTTPIHDSRSRLTFATHVRDSRLRPHSRLAVFATPPLCNSTTDRQTVSTPQHHLPSIPTLTLIKNKN